MISGTCEPRFASVQDAFAENFASRGESGAAVCIAIDGRVVVDLWGGWADTEQTQAWRADTLVNMFSIGKGLTATCAARAVGLGLLEGDAPVTDVWPAFGAGGKEAITTRHFLTHQAGLPAVRKRLPPGAMLQWSTMVDALAEQEPWWAPGTQHGYHVNTFGFLVGEVLRRTTGKSVGEMLREEIAGPLGADVHIGLPDREFSRVARFAWLQDPIPEHEPPGFTEAQLMEFNAYWNPSGLSGGPFVNTDEWRRAEIPSTNAHGTARGVARVYAALANGGEVDGVRIVDSGALAEATVEQVSGEDAILHRPSRFGLGFQLTQPERPLGPSPHAFGHFGAGGSLGFCDPDSGVAFGYVMNTMGPRWQNPRNRALIDALFSVL